ncbi:hypothetical protein EHQ53_04220 [Leptospira langatensis]|uniref:Dolichyl-phosphate-mannose--protein mannosyltransferase n=1 Tax=Leptospira langatensis TaxID=2484983 RepID=A0A5F1ZXZ8_9LEPT|nr:hypothetical protein [Leptospira langatensis]TGK00031.1 hypothetical protein EHO57_12085 [Leptospira langatensis]TGL42666.1 hypothetical protein EHQ53_04220 [Leptospira langatensis]
MNRSWDRILGFLAGLLTLAATGIMVSKNWQAFLEICPITDLLTWDENIRLTAVYDQFQDLRDGKIWRGILPFLEAATWPPLRPIFSLALLATPGSWPITWKDSFLGLAFYALCFPSIIYIASRITGSYIFGGLVSLFILAMSLHTSETPAYSLSSMLETQGMLSLLWVYFGLYKLYDSVKDLKQGEALPKDSRVPILVSVTLLLLFFTKYPYGLLLFISIFLYELISRFPEWIGFVRFAIRNHYKGLRLAFLIIVVLLVLSLPVLRVVTNWNLDQKSFKKVLYLLTVLVFLDFNYFLYKTRKEIGSVTPSSIRILYLYAILPSFFWLFANLDRVMSLVNAQMIVNKFVRSFILSLFESPEKKFPASHVFAEPWIFRLFFFFSIAILFYWIYSRRSEKTPAPKLGGETEAGKTSFLDKALSKLQNRTWPSFAKDPLFAITIIVFLQYIVIDASTGNKQLRHVFYPLPALLLILSFWFYRFIQLSSNVWKIASICVSLFFFFWAGSLFFRDGGLLSSTYFSANQFCLKGFDTATFQPARDFAKVIDPNGKYIAFNAFHEEENFQIPGRILASEFDLLFRQKTVSNGKYRNDSKYRWKNWDEFDKALYVGPSCELPEKYIERVQSLGYGLEPSLEMKHPSGNYCLREFRLIKK